MEIYLCNFSDLTDNQPQLFTLPVGEQVVVVKKGERVLAMERRCPHAGGLMDYAVVRGDKIICIWHGWQFNLNDGTCDDCAGAVLRLFPVSVKNGKVFLKLIEETE